MSADDTVTPCGTVPPDAERQPSAPGHPPSGSVPSAAEAASTHGIPDGSPGPSPDASLHASGNAGKASAANSRPLEHAVSATPNGRTSRILAGLLIASAILSIAGLLWWRLVPDAPPPPPLPTPGPAEARATSYEDAVAIAQAQADRWLPGARLLNATMQVDWPWQVAGGRITDLPATGWVTAVFLAPWDAPPGRDETAASLSVVLERLSRQIVLQETLGWETAALPAATPTPGLDSTVASILAERAGGAEFRRACPAVRHLSRIGLVSDAPGFPQHWLVTYEDRRRPDLHGLLLRIDATTGDVLARAQDAPPCPASEPSE